MKGFILLAAIFFASIVVAAQQKPKQPAQLLLMCTFHFGNPGLDAVKFKSADINSDTKQKEIRQVVDNIKNFNLIKYLS